ncbi:glutamate 5-kinase [Komagataeibacter nataicola]|uniref:Glutamate 5-kinase n=1 Tax=Komagataeibacter nataicola TaxID=265960 RepID=A0A9N7CU41_9PROT|nr:glutamate 5-kinase [Komagataeibacter nataicola]AQU86695.1 glutamate 5-kinase [Komagataeibacter nataicola]PYD65751.1 glutamate 5-kinase [Komagataeibacter nataicola]WEQ56360.1 glutamate 5-kinase [Komagataeibacter nataicola]GBR19242.1 gamma-glutamyl kinase [Komagataeibacter nataicola NRIC 0616]
MTETALPQLSHARRVVIKIGSALIVDPQQAAPRQPWLDSVAQDIAALRAQGTEVVVVSSGAIALARHQLGLTRPVLRLEEKQAAASVGQIRLAQAWTDALSRFDITAAQLLLTPDDTENRNRYLNARASLNTLLSLGCVPIINENDAIATTEIRFGDNDRLGARVAEMINADQLVLLSDIDGLYTADPRTNPDARHLPVIAELTASIEAMGGAPPPGYSSGGMRTKLMAARIATQAGCAMAIAKGEGLHPIAHLRDGGRCTWFLPAPDARSARKNWIAGSLTPSGQAVIDEGAVRALAGGSSLLPAGVMDVTGEFDRGDMIAVVDQNGQKIACGLAAYAADEARRIAGHQSDEIETLLGWQGADELIHRDDLVLLAKMESMLG